MRAIFAAITIAGVLTAGVPGSAQVRPLAAPPDLSGNWTIVPGADGSSPLGARFAVKQDASTITFTSDRQEVTYKLDDSETVRRTGMANGATSTHSSRARFVSNALVVTTRTDAGATGHWEDLMLVSQDRPGEITVVTSNATLTERGMATRVYKYKKANDDLPDRLTIQQFWQLSTDLSEPGETFISDNLVSNELSLAQAIPELVAWNQPGGVYLGVGPEQNFTYLAAVQARIGFIIDIRRENLLLHLMYKALFELSPDRVSFVSRLFSRPAPEGLKDSASVAVLMDAVVAAPQGPVETNVEDVRRVLVETYRLPLSTTDLAAIAQMHRTFFDYGPGIGYASTLNKEAGRLVSYLSLMKQMDGKGRALSFLGEEAQYRVVRDLQLRHLVVPVVGNFAGPKALRAIGAYVKSRRAIVSSFYVSNVEDYLGREPIPKNGEWGVFCANVASLPLDDRSVLIRPWGLAAYDAQGRLMASKKIKIASMDGGITYPAGTPPVWPPALSPIVPEVRDCVR